MKAFMTNGTYHFLKKLQDNHPHFHLYFMRNDSSTLAYYEADNKQLFAAGRAYDILLSVGTLNEKGYIVMNNIPVTEDGQPVFENRFKKRQHDIIAFPGFQAFRLLKPVKGNTYVVLTQWASENDFENWKNSEQFQEAHQGRKPAYFADRPFLTNYHMIKEE
ncbi:MULTISPECIES: antibiotic biosynthesis monooxygenase [unclassified Virgibacillus]|uniref:antibiotic biosynthesis monooxygenase family protein n=1 Tax=unclassified Virgibacillus TaxID=2620237 RepID=UPI0024DE8417|nr:antibiotic biosynthesis monooxygenase [Virgibacillus sp. LDC-1]